MYKMHNLNNVKMFKCTIFYEIEKNSQNTIVICRVSLYNINI